MAGSTDTRLTPAEGRKFALTVGAAFLLIALVIWWRRGEGIALMVIGGVGGALTFAGLVIPGHLTQVQRAWMGLAMLLSRVTTPILMGVIYFLVITPIGVLQRRFGKDPLANGPDEKGSYWQDADSPGSDLKRQF